MSKPEKSKDIIDRNQIDARWTMSSRARLSQVSVLAACGVIYVVVSSATLLAAPAGKTHNVVVNTMEVEELNSRGNPWDTGYFLFWQWPPDLRVDVARREPELEDKLAALNDKEKVRKDELEPTDKQDGAAVEKARDRLTRDPELLRLRREIDALRRQFMADTSVADDTLKHTFNTATVAVSEGDRIKLSVYDQDGAVDDLIGETEIEITTDILKQRPFPLKFGQVRSFTLEFVTRRR